MVFSGIYPAGYHRFFMLYAPKKHNYTSFYYFYQLHQFDLYQLWVIRTS